MGLRSEHASLLTPRVDACTAIFLGSRQSCNQQAKKAPGPDSLTKGWIEVGASLFDEHELNGPL